MYQEPQKIQCEPLIKSDALPSTLYHYTNAEGLIGILKDKCVFATDIRFLNDASEFSHAMEAYRAHADRRYAAASTTKDKYLWGYRISIEFQPHRLPMFIFSLSSERNSLSQWRAYGSVGSGAYAIGFETEKILQLSIESSFPETDYLPTMRLNRCYYEQEEKEQLFDAIHQTTRQCAGGTDDNPLVSSAEQARDRAVWESAAFLKNSAFRDEHEWRILLQNGLRARGPAAPVKFRSRRGVIVPYVEISLGNPLPIKEIVVGPLNSEMARVGVQELIWANTDQYISVEDDRIPYRG